MNQETSNYVTEPAAIAKLVISIMNADQTSAASRATYLRSLLAATQEGIAGKPVLRASGRAKRPELEAAISAFEKVQEAFYAAVLAAVPPNLSAKDKQSRTSFARSAASTLRRAIKTGWNPLGTSVGGVSKGLLAAWVVEHREPVKITPARAEKRVMGLVERISDTLSTLPKEEAARILAIAAPDLGFVEPQRITGMKLRRHEARAH